MGIGNSKYGGETGKTLKALDGTIRSGGTQPLHVYLITVNSLDTGNLFAFDEAQIIGKAQTKAGRLLMIAFYSMNTQVTDTSPLKLSMFL